MRVSGKDRVVFISGVICAVCGYIGLLSGDGPAAAIGLLGTFSSTLLFFSEEL